MALDWPSVKPATRSLLDKAEAAQDDLLLDEALDYFRQAFELEPDNPFCIEALAGIMGRLHRWSDKLPLERRLLEMEPDNASRWYYLGVLLLAFMKRPQDAVDPCRRAIELDPTKLAFHLVLIQALSGSRDHQAAIAHARTILASPPFPMTDRDRAFVCMELGNALARAGRYREAELRYREVLDLAQEDDNLAAGANRGIETVAGMGQSGPSRSSDREDSS